MLGCADVCVNLLGDGISMPLGNYLSTKSEVEYKDAEMAREEWEIENVLRGRRRS